MCKQNKLTNQANTKKKSQKLLKMSLLQDISCGLVISHKLYVDSIYQTVLDNGSKCKYEVNKCLFQIREPYKNVNGLQRPDSEYSTDVNFVRNKLKEVNDKLTSYLKQSDVSSDNPKDAANAFSLAANSRKVGTINGGNNSDNNLLTEINGEKYLIPRKCRFYNSDVEDLGVLAEEKFDAILLDPPWWNKYIRRKRKRNSDDGYQMMWNKQLAKLPINSLLAEDGIVCVWCTNSPSNIDELLNRVFPEWEVEFVSQWFWLKVTESGMPVTPFSIKNGKQPFERIIFGRRKAARLQPFPGDGKILVSVPSAIHSHKPPLTELLQPYLPENPKLLEVFARYLLPDWTSFGNEVLKLQHVSLYSKVEES